MTLLANLLIPSRALHWGVLTRPWPELDLWCRANPAMGDRVLPEALWEAAAADSKADPLPSFTLDLWTGDA